MERKKIKRIAVRRRCTAAAFCSAVAMAAWARGQALNVFNDYLAVSNNASPGNPDTLDPITLTGSGTATLNSFTFRTDISLTGTNTVPTVNPVAVITFWDNVYYSTATTSANVLTGATNLGSITTTVSPASGANVYTNPGVGEYFDTTATPTSTILLPAGVSNLSSSSMVYVQISYFKDSTSTAPSNYATGTGESISADASMQSTGALTAGSEPYWSYVDGSNNGIISTSDAFGASGSKLPKGGTAFFVYENQMSMNASIGTQFIYTGTDATTPATWDYSSLNFTSSGSPAAFANLSNGTTVVFDDTATGSTTVSIVAGGVTPSITLFNNNNSSYTLNGPGGITGIGGLYLTGSGNVTLNTINTYTGLTSVGNGTLTIGAAGSIASTSIQVNSTGTLNLPGGNASLSAAGTSITAAVSGTMNVGTNYVVFGTLTGSGALNFNGTSPSLVLNAATYSGSFGSSNGPLTILLNSSGGTISSTIGDGSGGPTSLVVDSAWTLSGVNSYSGGTILKAGTVTVGVSGLGNGPVNLSGGTITTTSGLVTYVPGNVIGGALTVKGTGTLKLAGNNSFVGAVTASTGTVQFDSAAALGKATSIAQSGSADIVINDSSGSAGIVNGKPINIALAGAGDATGNGALRSYNGSNAVWAGNVSVGTVASFISTGVGSFELTGAITGTGTAGITFGNGATDFGFSTLILDPPTSTSNTYAAQSNVASRSGNQYVFLTVQLGNNNGFSTASGLAFTTGAGFGEVDMNGYNQSVTYLLSNTNTSPVNYQITNSQSTLSTLTITNGNSSSGVAETFFQGINGDIALVKTGTGNEILTGASNFSGGTTIANGIITAGSSTALGTGPVSLTGGTLALNNLSGGTIQSIANPINVLSGTTSAIQLRVLSTTTNTGASVGQINISSGASVAVTIPAPVAATRGVLFTPAVSIATSTGGAFAGKLDLGYNDLVVTTSTLAQVTVAVAGGYNNGAWNGQGIASSVAASDTTHLTALGVIVDDNGSGTPLYGTGGTISSFFDGSTPADGNILVKYTYYGDANLDGKVDGTDYSLIDNGYLQGLSGWQNGDFNYDGVINGSDYTLIDNAFNSQNGVNPLDVVAAPTAQIAGNSAVPEPTTLSVLTIGIAGLLGRRRRKIQAAIL